MSSIRDRVAKLVGWGRCCPPPPAVKGVAAASGGGSAEVIVTFDPLPIAVKPRFYRVYRRKATGLWTHLAVVTDDTLGALAPGKLGLVDTPDGWPWASGADPEAERCYAVSCVAETGLEGPLSRVVCAIPTT